MNKNGIANINQFKMLLNNYRTEFGMFLVLIIFVIIMSFASPYFLTRINTLNILSQISVVGILAIGQTFVIRTAGIDLSLGALMGLCAMVMGLVMVKYGIFFGISAALIVGVLGGIVNGVLVGYFKLAAFVVTLGMMSIAQSLTYVISDGNSVTNLPESFAILGGDRILGIPYYLILLVILFAIGIYISHKTKVGRVIYAIGSNERATKMSGINVSFYKTIPYIIVGLMAALAAMLQSSRLMAIDPNFGSEMMLDSIAAVVIGGTSLMGGRGTLIGTAIGVILIGILRNSLNLLGVSPFWQGSAIGTVIIIAILIERLTNKEENN